MERLPQGPQGLETIYLGNFISLFKTVIQGRGEPFLSPLCQPTFLKHLVVVKTYRSPFSYSRGWSSRGVRCRVRRIGQFKHNLMLPSRVQTFDYTIVFTKTVGSLACFFSPMSRRFFLLVCCSLIAHSWKFPRVIMRLLSAFILLIIFCETWNSDI